MMGANMWEPCAEALHDGSGWVAKAHLNVGHMTNAFRDAVYSVLMNQRASLNALRGDDPIFITCNVVTLQLAKKVKTHAEAMSIARSLRSIVASLADNHESPYKHDSVQASAMAVHGYGTMDNVR